MFKSEVTKLNKVVFPEFNNERIYMQKFYKNEGLPKHLRHWTLIPAYIVGANPTTSTFLTFYGGKWCLVPQQVSYACLRQFNSDSRYIFMSLLLCLILLEVL